jgi:hypothetical protein
LQSQWNSEQINSLNIIQFRIFVFTSKNVNIETYRIYKTLILPVILYGYEACSLLLRMFEDGVLRSIFGPEMEEVTEGWRKCT